MAVIKQITVGSSTYDIDAQIFGGRTVEQWEALLQTSFSLVVLDSLPAADATAYDNYKTSIVLIPSETSEPNNIKDEYIIVRSGAEGSYTYAWELIGSSDVDLANYVQKGTYTTAANDSPIATGSGGGETIITSSDGSQTATGSATIEYDKAASATGEAGGGTANTNTSNVSGGTVQGSSFSFTGTTATISGTVGNSSVDSHTHATDVTATNITSYSAPSMSSITFTPNTLQSLTTKNYGFSSSTSNIMYAPTVSTLGVLSWSTSNASTQDVLGGGAAASLSGGVFSAGTLVYSTVTAAGKSSAATLTVPGTSFSVSYQPAGSIGGSVTLASHSHTYTAPAAHTHSISNTTTTVTATVSVAVTSHTHSVTVSSHTHSIATHTHSITFS